MKNLFFIGLILALVFNGCNTINNEIQRSKVTVDTITHIWTFNENGKKVTGTVISEKNLENGTLYIQKNVIKDGVCQKISGYYNDGKLLFEVGCVDGMLEGEQKWYYPSGKTMQSNSYIKDKQDGLLRVYYEDGTIALETHYKNGLQHGTEKRYYNGVQVKEIVYEMGKEIKSYDFDGYGQKIIPPTEYLELVDYATGYYKHINSNNEILYQPIVIMKWTNISGSPLNKTIKLKGEFFNDNEEWDEDTEYLQQSSKTPLQPGKIRQVYLKSSIGYVYSAGVAEGNISCKISIDNKHYKTLKIKNQILYSNRID